MKIAVALMGLLALASPALARKKHKLPPPAPTPVVAIVVPAAVATPDNLWHLDLSTGGSVVIQLRPDVAPNHVARVKQLTRAGFYDGLKFHRVMEGFMAQGGDPLGTGEGGSSLPNLKPEFNDLPHVRGAVSMARATAPDSANSQFFIIFMPTLRLDRSYTVFGRVTSGMNFVDAIERGEPPANPSKIVHAWIEADGSGFARVPLPPVAAPTLPATPAPATPAPATPVDPAAPTAPPVG